jgi:hypothetical protein
VVLSSGQGCSLTVSTRNANAVKLILLIVSISFTYSSSFFALPVYDRQQAGGSDVAGKSGVAARVAEEARAAGARSTALANRNKEVGAHRDAQADHRNTHFAGVGLLRVMRTEPATCQRTCDHDGALPP